ncbi:MAG: DUF898 domain-containing protein, partial [Verrucomicrobiaceae bacterium]|nr:DUF898 domain-containing protein [Verrucomicrobiaceae bacterium]
ISILKGNLIFGGLFIIYTIAGSVFPPLGIGIALVIGVLMPWLVQKALRFRAHNTVHRNVRFHFRGTTGESYAVFLGFPMLVGFTLGLLVPYVQFRQRKYYFGNMAWGSAAADMRGTVGFFYKTFFKVVGVVLLIAVIAVAASMVVIKSSPVAMDELRGMQEERGTPASEASTPPVEVNSTISDETEKKEEQVTVFQMLVGALGVVVVIGLYLLMFLLFTYYQVRTNNYAINSTQWGALGRLESRVRVRDLMWLYLTNGIVVLLTLGLMIPWVKVRMARYRASRTSFLCAGSLDSVASTLSAEQSAIGDAGADVFDFDIGF